MGFPYSYSDEIYTLKEIQDKSGLFSEIIGKLKKSQKRTLSNEKNEIKIYSPFFKIPFSLELEIKSNEIIYSINFEILIKIILIVIIFTALFSYNSLKFFFIFSVTFSVLFYFLNLLIINSYVKSEIEKILKTNNIEISEEEVMSEEQKNWINDANRCPACGADLSEIDLICPECGLHLKRSRHTIPLDTSKYKKETVKYHYKKK